MSRSSHAPPPTHCDGRLTRFRSEIPAIPARNRAGICLKNRNRKNDDIWPLIVTELKARRFKAEELSERQLRRIVYG